MPNTEKPIFTFQETRIRFKNSSETAVNIRRLSIPAQDQAIENLALPNYPETSRVGIPVKGSVPANALLVIKPKTTAAKPAVVGTSI